MQESATTQPFLTTIITPTHLKYHPKFIYKRKYALNILEKLL